ncbi:MAG: S8 family peptidase [Melioribacter sp.]|nr:S8 family peptidase [Melioribacter sp.]
MRVKFIIISLILYLSIYSQEKIIEQNDLIYLSNTIIIKIKDATLSEPEIKERINKSLKKKIIKEIKQAFERQSLRKGNESLSRIYFLNIEEGFDPINLSKKISKIKDIEWAEPKFIRKVTYIPNDSIYLAGTQINLTQINAAKAWDITKGDSNIVIGIVDTGVDWKHPDLSANIYRDKNGNIVGYDFGGLNGIPDNDPSEDKAPPLSSTGYHGTHVAGIAAAVTNNLIGVASIGYNCSIMPVKVSRNDKRQSNGDPYIYYGFEGIKYAAEHGAKVINCSWGGYGYSRYEQEIIDYATSLGALIVAAAGNENRKMPFYPASYNGVLSVGWIDIDGNTKASNSNYGYTLDVMAPGTSIISTWPTISGRKYRQISGSSMASPLVAGLAALVFSKNPEYSPLQVAEKIRVTCDDIYSFNSDTLKYLLGRGRINAYKAVKDTNVISIRAKNIKFIDSNGNGLLEKGEQISINMTFENFLNPASNILVELSTNDPSIKLIKSSLTINQLNTLQTINNQNEEFTFLINEYAEYNHTVNFILKFTSNNYTDFQWFTVRINPTYDTHNANKITMTITSKGNLGFNDYPDNQEGDGFKFNKGENLMFEGALMYGTSETKVMDAARVIYTQSNDFKIIEQFKITNHNDSQIGYTIFDDSNFGNGRLGIETYLKSYCFNQPPYDKFIILELKFKNTTTQNINGFYAGYFFDWDIPADSATIDSTNYDKLGNFGYAYCINKSIVSTYVGAALISSDKYGYYPVDNEQMLFDPAGFTKSEKWFTLSSGIKNFGAGPSDISFTISGGPFDIPAGETLTVAFAIAAGESLDELRNSIIKSREKYEIITSNTFEDNLPKVFLLFQNYPNPFNPITTISYQLPATTMVSLKVYDILGREISTLVNEIKKPGKYEVKFDGTNLSSGVYFYALQAGENFAVKKMMLIK